MFSDAVAFGSLGAVAVCIVIFVYLSVLVVKKMNSDQSDD